MYKQKNSRARGSKSGKSNELTKYINPRTDFSFGLIFGKEPNKDLLIDFLNGIFKGRKVIKDLQYNNPAHKGPRKKFRKTVFDLYCTDQDGRKFIVEMQQATQKYFKDRIIFYSANLIQEQGISVNANWDYKLPEIYSISLMNFCFDDSHPDQYSHHVKLVDMNTNTVFYNKLEYIFVELPKFQKKEDELETKEENWLFTINNLEKLDDIPLSLRDIKEFKKLFEVAQVGKLNQKDMNAYQQNLKTLRDDYAAEQYAKEIATKEGRAEGLAKGLSEGLAKGLSEGLAKGITKGITKGEYKKALEIALEMKKEGMNTAQIVKFTKLTAKQVEAL